MRLSPLCLLIVSYTHADVTVTKGRRSLEHEYRTEAGRAAWRATHPPVDGDGNHPEIESDVTFEDFQRLVHELIFTDPQSEKWKQSADAWNCTDDSDPNESSSSSIATCSKEYNATHYTICPKYTGGDDDANSIPCEIASYIKPLPPKPFVVETTADKFLEHQLSNGTRAWYYWHFNDRWPDIYWWCVRGIRNGTQWVKLRVEQDHCESLKKPPGFHNVSYYLDEGKPMGFTIEDHNWLRKHHSHNVTKTFYINNHTKETTHVNKSVINRTVVRELWIQRNKEYHEKIHEKEMEKERLREQMVFHYDL